MELITAYLHWLQWIPLHPVQSIIILVCEFCLMYWIYYRFNQQLWIKIIFGLLFQPQNFVANMFVLTMIGLEFPRWGEGEYFCTHRLKRWKLVAPHTFLEKWRFHFAWAVCNQLNKADPEHC